MALTYSFPPEVLGSPTRSVLFFNWGIGYHRTGPVTGRLMPSVDVPAVVNERVGEVPIAELLARRQFSIELKGTALLAIFANHGNVVYIDFTEGSPPCQLATLI